MFKPKAKERCSRLFSVFELPGHQAESPLVVIYNVEGQCMNIPILIIDDERTWLHNLAFILRHKNYQVTAIDNGKEGIEKIRENPGYYKILLLDLMLADMTGLDVLAALKADPTTKDIAVILQTGSQDMPPIMQAIEMGAVCCLRKPYNHRLLYPLLEDVLDGKLPETKVMSIAALME